MPHEPLGFPFKIPIALSGLTTFGALTGVAVYKRAIAGQGDLAARFSTTDIHTVSLKLAMLKTAPDRRNPLGLI